MCRLDTGRRGLLLAAAGSGLSGVAAAQASRRLDFEAASLDAPPPGFTFGLTGGGPTPRWVVLSDTTSPAGPKVLAQTSADRTDDRYPLAILDGFTAQDVALSVQFRPVSGRVDQAAGLVARYLDARSYYVARANALENNIRLYYVLNGRRIQFAGVDVVVSRDRWQALGLRLQGNRLTVSLNGREVLTVTDATYAGPGRVGLWTKADSVTHFDAFEVEALG